MDKKLTFRNVAVGLLMAVAYLLIFTLDDFQSSLKC